MIHVDRGRVPPPPSLLALGAEERKRATEFFKARSSRQARFEFRVFSLRAVRQALLELFHGKCAYCEARVDTVGSMDIELYRPKASVLEVRDHPGYWWLAMDWDNLLASCAYCNRVRDIEGVRTGKANRFPLLDEGQRAYHPGEEVREQPVLLNPCIDYPESHLVFDANGRVLSDSPRGQGTISVLGLNRPALVAARRLASERVQLQIRRVDRLLKVGPAAKLVGYSLQDELAALRVLTDEREEFAGLKRQMVKEAIARIEALTATQAQQPQAAESISDLKANVPNQTPEISKVRKRQVRKSFIEYENAQANYSLAGEEGKRKYREQSRLIESVVVENIRAIERVELDLTSRSGRTPWLMLLGENGTGKSTILQAMSLVLVGARAFVRLATTRGIRPTDFIRYGCESGQVSLQLTGFPGPHVLEFHPDRVRFHSPTRSTTTVLFAEGQPPTIDGAGWEPQTLLLGYGATRLLPRVKAELSTDPEEFSRVDNLFDPFMPLLDADAWLNQLSKDAFDDLAPVLRDLLALPPEAELVQEEGHVMVVAYGAHVPLHRLSDGFQGVIAMTADILQVAMRVWPSLQEAEGTVMLDEVGAHLHPTWKMRIVNSLRRALPAMQFVATTHDPLCLRGLGENEVTVMRRDDGGRVEVVSDLPSPSDFRVDQLLTSEFFGLSSTVDPETEAVFDEYYTLLAMKNPEKHQSERLEVLRAELKDRRHLGTTLRDSLMYEAIDKILARHRQQRRPLAELKQEAVEEITKIWDEERR